jgi:hypothetical protein
MARVSAQAETTQSSLEREWWLRLGMVFTEPRTVFAWLRDDTDAAAQARQEPVLLVGFLAACAGVLTSNGISHALDDFGLDGVDLAVVVLFATLIYGIVGFFFFGALVYVGEQLADGLGSYRRARHILAFACAPLALSLVLWPVRLALYGGDLFRSGGDDHGTGALALHLVDLGFALWAVALLVAGVRAVHGWTVARSGAAVALAVVLLPVLALLAWFL